MLTQESSRGTVLWSAWKSLGYRVGIGPSAMGAGINGHLYAREPADRALPPEFRGQYAHAREAGRIFGIFRRLYACARCERNGLGKPNVQYLESLKGAVLCCFVMPPKSFRQKGRWTT